MELLQRFISDKRAPRHLMISAGLWKVMLQVLLLPLLILAFRFSLDIGGVRYLRLDNLRQVLTIPYLLIFGIEILTLALVYCSQYGYLLGVATFETSFLTSLKGLPHIIAASSRIFLPKNWPMLLFLLLYLPGNPYRFAQHFLVNAPIPTFITKAIYSDQRLWIPFVLLIVVCVILSAAFAPIFHLFLFNKVSFKQAAKEALALTRPYFGQLLLVSALIQLAFFLFQLASSWLIPLLLTPLTVQELDSDWLLLRWGILRAAVEAWHFFVDLFFFLCWIRLVTLLVKKEGLALEYKPQPVQIRNPKLLKYQRFFAPTKASVKTLSFFLICTLLWLLGRGYFLSFRGEEQAAFQLFRPVPLVMGHRGAGDDAPENSLSSIDVALKHGAESIEIDVQLTKDGQVILLHDSTYRRTAGVNQRPQDLSYEETRQLKINKGFESKFPDEKLPLLSEFLEEIKGRVLLNIELKPSGDEEELVDQTAKVLEASPYKNRCILSSLNEKALDYARKKIPGVQTAYILPLAYGSVDTGLEHEFYMLEESFATAKRIADLQARGKIVFVWMINDEASLSRAYENGADGVITDQIGFCREWLLQKELVRDSILDEVEKYIDQQGDLPDEDEATESAPALYVGSKG